MICFLFLYNIYIGMLFALLYIAIAIINYRSVTSMNEKKELYLKKISLQVEKATEKVSLELPIGIVIYDSDYVIDWVNPYLLNVHQDSLVGETLQEVYSTNMVQSIKQEQEEKIGRASCRERVEI